MDNILGERCLTVREPAWHHLGPTVQEDVAPSDAIVQARVDFAVTREPLTLPDGTDSGYVAIVREALEDDDNVRRVFGVAKNYELVHISQLASQLDGLPYAVSSVGTIRKGADVFVCFDMGDDEVLGEKYRNYFSVIHPYTPGSSWKMLVSPTRVVCQNTLEAALTNNDSIVRVTHAKGATARIDAALVQKRLAASVAKFKETMEQTCDYVVEREGLDALLDRVYPYVHELDTLATNPEAAAKRRESTIAYVEGIKRVTTAVYDRFCEEQPTFADTGYALYQAVAESADYRNTRGEPDAKRIGESTLVGVRAAEKRRALELVLAN